MSDGKNHIIGSLGKIKSFFSHSAAGIVIAALAGLIGKVLSFLSTHIFTIIKVLEIGIGTTLPRKVGKAFTEVGAKLSLGERLKHIFMMGSATSPITKFGEAITNGLENAFISLAHPVNTAKELFSSFKGSMILAKDGVVNFASSMKDNLVNGFTTVTGAIKGFIQNPAAGLQSILGTLKGGVSNLWGVIKAHPMAVGTAAIAALVASFIDAWKHSDELREHVESIWNTIKDFGKFLFDGVKKLWDEYIKPAWDDIKAALRDIQDNVLIPLWNTISGIVDWVVKLINNTLKPVISALLPYIGNIIKSVMGVISGIITFLSGVFSGDWSKAWSGIVKIFDSIWSTLKTIAVAPLNGIIFLVNKLLSLLQTGLNWIVDKVNAFGIHKDTIFGRVDIGFNLPHVNLGQLGYIQLAKGGVIDETTMAMVGEYPGAKHNPEIVTPASAMREIFTESNEDLVGVMIQVGRQIVEAINNNETTISIGDDVISAAAARGAKNFKKMTGRNQFAI